jgi:hypothetical protein
MIRVYILLYKYIYVYVSNEMQQCAIGHTHTHIYIYIIKMHGAMNIKKVYLSRLQFCTFSYKAEISTIYIFFSYGAAAHSGLRPPHT